MSSLKEQLSIIDEAYLIGIANKGIVNRAQKDLAASGIRYSLNDTTLEASFTDGTSVSITGGLSNYKCSCPSRTICKHVIMALINASVSTDAEQRGEIINSEVKITDYPEDSETTSGRTVTDQGQSATSSGSIGQEQGVTHSDSKSAATPSGKFDYLFDYKRDMLIKEYGKSVYNDVLFKVKSGETCVIEESSILVLKMMDGAFIVRFLPGVSASESVCSCKIKNCRHRLEAIMQYIKHKTGKLEFEPVMSETDVNTEIIPIVSDFIETIFRIGLIRLPAEYAEKCAQFAVLCHGAGFAIFERLFETCSKELTLYEQKSASFNENSLIRNLTRIYQLCCEIRNGGTEAAVSLAGKFKRQYMELPKLRVMGIGAYPWYAKSGFCGVTALFFAPDLRQTFTFTSSRPVESEKEAADMIKQSWHAKSVWNLPISFGAISKAELSLTGAKISDNGRLSSSGNTSAVMIKPVTSLETNDPEVTKNELEVTKNGGILLDDFTKIKHLFVSDTERERLVYTVLKISDIGEGSFNKVTQTYSIQLTDSYENKLSLTLRYSKINETAILNFEYIERKSIVPDAITVSVSLSDEDFQVILFPVAIRLNGEIINIGEDKLFTINEKSDYAKFFNVG